MSKEKEYSDQFEDISTNIIRYIFQNEDGITITPTRRKKDGGYDVVVNCQISNVCKRIYFECKLREKNLNFRDIAANVIIAFNRGAAAFVALINHEFTEQTGDELARFSRKSILTIKIIASAEIQQLISTGKISVPPELMELISTRKANLTGDYELLKINLNQSILEQLLPDPVERELASMESISGFFSAHEFKRIINSLNAGKMVFISGVWGSGAEQIAEAAERYYSPQSILKIDARPYPTVQEVILDILAKTWAVPKEKIVNCLTKDQLEQITEKIDGIDNDPDTISILKEILCRSDIDRSLQSSQNFIAADYVCKLFDLRQQNFGFIFCVKHLQFAKKEVFDFLNYLLSCLSQKKIACLIVLREPEYLLGNDQDNLQLKALKETMRVYVNETLNIELAPLTDDQAKQYVSLAAPNLSDFTVDKLVKKVGTRIEVLQLLIDHAHNYNIKDDLLTGKSIAQELQMITKNNPFSFFSCVLPEYESSYPAFFALSYIFDCQVPYAFCSWLAITDEQLEELDQAALFQYDQEYIIPRNEFVKDWICKHFTPTSFQIIRLAEKLNEAMGEQSDNYITEKISIYRILHKYDRAFSMLKIDISKLSRNRQYTKLERELCLAVQMSHETHSMEQKAYYQVELLNILMIQKRLNSDEATRALDELQCYVQENIGCPNEIKMALIFFRVKRAFKKSQYSDNSRDVQQAKEVFQQCAVGELTDNTGDWLGSICACYALIVKETQGNQKALEVFNKSLEQLPDSFELRRETLSHTACMNLMKNPRQAYQNYKAIIALFAEEGAEYVALPFHEYGDCAMSLLLCKELEKAQDEANSAIKICRSNGILDEVGRDLNILGCIKVFQNQYDQAKRIFHEALSMMNTTECQLYAWRATLNYIQCCLMENGTKPDNLLSVLENTYMEFKELWSTKIHALVTTTPLEEFQQTQEYRALLVFAFCYCRLTDAEGGLKKILDQFHLGQNKSALKKTLNLYLAGKDILIDSPYVSKNFICLLG